MEAFYERLTVDTFEGFSFRFSGESSRLMWSSAGEHSDPPRRWTGDGHHVHRSRIREASDGRHDAGSGPDEHCRDSRPAERATSRRGHYRSVIRRRRFTRLFFKC